MYKILIIDDDLDLLEMLTDALEDAQYDVTAIDSFEDFVPQEANIHDVIILDVMMPNIDGFEICQILRKYTINPIIFLTAKVEEYDIVKGLNLGADDYITKPFSVKALLARVDAHIRREHDFTDRKEFTISEVKFDFYKKSVSYRGNIINLTKKEYELCLLLATHENRVYTREEIYTIFYNIDSCAEFRVITQFIYQIRKKLLKYNIDPIESVWGIGYRWKR